MDIRSLESTTEIIKFNCLDCMNSSRKYQKLLRLSLSNGLNAIHGRNRSRKSCRIEVASRASGAFGDGGARCESETIALTRSHARGYIRKHPVQAQSEFYFATRKFDG